MPQLYIQAAAVVCGSHSGVAYTRPVVKCRAQTHGFDNPKHPQARPVERPFAYSTRARKSIVLHRSHPASGKTAGKRDVPITTSTPTSHGNQLNRDNPSTCLMPDQPTYCLQQHLKNPDSWQCGTASAGKENNHRCQIRQSQPFVPNGFA